MHGQIPNPYDGDANAGVLGASIDLPREVIDEAQKLARLRALDFNNPYIIFFSVIAGELDVSFEQYFYNKSLSSHNHSLYETYLYEITYRTGIIKGVQELIDIIHARFAFWVTPDDLIVDERVRVPAAMFVATSIKETQTTNPRRSVRRSLIIDVMARKNRHLADVLREYQVRAKKAATGNVFTSKFKLLT